MRGPALVLLTTLAAPLPAQVALAAGDGQLSLALLLHDHPEGMILTVPGPAGQSLGTALQAVLDQEPARELQLNAQELGAAQRAGRELLALRGWGADKPRWVLLGPDGQMWADGTEAPTSAQLVALYRSSPLRTRADRLRAFLREAPDQAEALAQLVLDLRTLAERRTEKATAGTGPAAGDGAKPPPAELTEAEDARIWAEYAERYRQLMEGDAWLDGGPTTASPVPSAAQLTSFAAASPLLRDLAARLLPGVETRLRARLTDERRWKVWLSLREAGAQGRPADLLAGAAPPPGTRHWPPAAALDAFVEDAQERGDWREAESVLQAAYDRNQDLLQALEAAAREEAAPGAAPPLATHFGFGGWTGETALLVEAKLRLGKAQEADRIFREAFARAPRPEVAREAAALAQRCGADALADQWARLGK
jgi:hypothetical protein